MNVWYDKNSKTPFAFCTSGLQVFVGMSSLQGETRCEALERLNIIANVFWLLFISIDPSALEEERTLLSHH